jgi:phage shock protein E
MRKIINVKLVGLFALLWAGLVSAEAVWVDVRTAEEYQQSYIEGDLHIPHQSIVAGLEPYALPKGAEIRLYCRSGNRAGIAKQSLQAAGYTVVINAGSIEDARQARESVVKLVSAAPL